MQAAGRRSVFIRAVGDRRSGELSDEDEDEGGGMETGSGVSVEMRDEGEDEVMETEDERW